MFHSTKGVLITTDQPTKQLISHLNEINNRKIILNELDDKHLFIAAEYVDFVKSEVQKIYEQHTFERK